jgi:hypothetical protein
MKRNVRVSEYTRKQLTALCAATGLNEAGVITLALDRLAAQLDVEPCREKSSGAGSSPQPDAN